MRHSPQNFLCKSIKNNGYKLLILTKNAQCPHSTNTENPNITTRPGVRKNGSFYLLAFVLQMPYLPKSRSHPGECCPSSRPRPALEAARTCAARPGRTVRSCRSPRSRAPAQDQTGHAAADPRRSPAAGTRCRSDQSPGAGPGQEKDFHK